MNDSQQHRATQHSPQEKRALLARLLREKAQRPQPHPASFSQRRLWFLDRLEPGSIGYVMPAALRLKGALNMRAFEDGLREVVRRHAALRTTFSDIEGEPLQFVHPTATVEPDLRDLRAVAQEERERRAAEVLMQEVGRPFDLEHGSLCRVLLLRMDDDEHILLINLHHIVSDGWSTAVLIGELVAFYKAALVGQPAQVAALPIQYADYARWQRAWLDGADCAAEMAYWRKQLGGRMPRLELPADYARPASHDYRGDRCNTVLDERTTEALAALSRREGATLFMTLLAAFKVLLYRQTEQEDVAIGTVVSGRQRPETEPLIGFFVNTLVLRTDLSNRPTFLETLRRVKEVSLGALANQSLPFEKLVEELNPERNAGKNPLFEILFNFGNMPRASVELAGLSLGLVELEGIQAKQAITLYADEGRGQIALSLVYQRALFAPRRMRILLAQYVVLLEQIAETPDKPIDAYSLRVAETLNVLPDPRQPLARLPYEPVTDAIRRWAEHTPGATALRQLGRELTYGRLQQRANEISRCLSAHGLQPGDTVAVLGPRSFGLVAAIVAVMQSGAVLLLIDRTHPENRRKQLLAEGRARQLLAVCEEDAAASEPGDFTSLPATRIAAAAAAPIDAAPAGTPIPRFQPPPDYPAYICFTSGSTGIPKGVLCTHRGLSHFIAWEREEFGVGPADRVAQLSRLSFDVAMRDIFLPLTSGATLCLPPDQTRFDTSQILGWLESEEVSIVHIVPAVAQASLAALAPSIGLQSLRWALFAGEPLTEQLVRRWRESFPRSGGIANLYGPTETTLAKFCHRVADPPSPGVQPVGHPLPHTQGLVMNAAGQLCGVGEPGQIVIRTPYRSLGYINLDGTGQGGSGSFVADPFGDADDRLYLTGDRGKYRADGLLEIQGRMDHQIKIGGVRIELDEIQSVLARHPDVSACVAAVKGDGDDRRLVAYLVAKLGTSASTVSLRALVRRELPRYQHPSHYVLLEEMPLLPNGKIDRQALPEPGNDRPDTEEPYLAPRTPMELTLCGIWEDLLKINPVGVRDDFFDLGGHSLLAVRLMAQIDKAAGRSLPLATLFEGATVEKLALRLTDASEGESGPLVAIQPEGPRRPLFFVHPAGGNVLCYAGLANRLGRERPFYGLQSPFSDLAPPLDRIENMATRYLESILSAQPVGPYLIGGWSMGGIVAYEIAQQLIRRGERVALLALLDHRVPERGDPDEVLDEITLMRRFFDGAVDLDNASLEAMSAEQRLDHFLHNAQRLNLISSEVGASQVRAYLKVYLANLQALRRYSTQAYPGQVTLLKTKPGIDDTDPTLGWGTFAGGVEVFDVPGRHHELVLEPHVEVVAKILKDCLKRADPAV